MDSNEQPSVGKVVEAYCRFVPQQFLNLMGKKSITQVTLGDHIERTMTVLFADIRNFTPLSESMTPQQNFDFINAFLSTMEPVLCEHGAVIDKYIGDAIMALFPKSADAAIRGSVAMLRALDIFNEERGRNGHAPIRIGIGLNTGVVMLGTIGGPTRMDGTVISDAVNLSARVESMSKAYGTPLIVSEHTLYAMEEPERYHIRFIDRVRMKGKKQPESVYEVYDADPPEILVAKDKSRRIFEEGVAHYHFKSIIQAKQLLSQCLEICECDPVAKVYLERCNRFEKTGIHESTGEVDLEVKWDNAFAIAHTHIDRQHQRLFACTKDFVDTIRECDNYLQASPIINHLSKEMTTHFRDEEKVMEDAKYSFLDRQKQQHARFQRDFEALKLEIERDLTDHRLYLLFRMQILVVDWLIHHTAGVDGHFRKYIRLRKEGPLDASSTSQTDS